MFQPGHYVSLPADFSNSSALTWFASLFSGLGDGSTPVSVVCNENMHFLHALHFRRSLLHL